jgi:dTDP-4-amino-4,6-dideoxygalactose transaminase
MGKTIIGFNTPPQVGTELDHLRRVMDVNKLSGDGPYNSLCGQWFKDSLDCDAAIMTPSCTAALEMAAILADIGAGDEVIVPSYTFVSTATAFALRGAKIIFVDVDPMSMNMDVEAVKQAITPQTKAVVPVHYAGTSCDMDKLMALASEHDLFVIEDAAQAVGATYNGRALGSIGHFGCYSFHETKNYTAGGEGGLLVVNDPQYVERAYIIQEKGTNRHNFKSGLIDKYTWVDIGSSFLASELQAAYLYAQLMVFDEIKRSRLAAWDEYYVGLESLNNISGVDLMAVPKHNAHNAHMFYIKCRNIDERSELISYLDDRDIKAVFHYIPLHSSPAGLRLGHFSGEDKSTTAESERLLRLPIHYQFGDASRVCEAVLGFYAS